MMIIPAGPQHWWTIEPRRAVSFPSPTPVPRCRPKPRTRRCVPLTVMTAPVNSPVSSTTAVSPALHVDRAILVKKL